MLNIWTISNLQAHSNNQLKYNQKMTKFLDIDNIDLKIISY